GVDGNGEVAEEKAVGDRLVKKSHQLADGPDLAAPLKTLPRKEPEPRRVDATEEAVASDDEPEELGILRAAAGNRLAVGTDEHERFDGGDDRLPGPSAAAHVRHD